MACAVDGSSPVRFNTLGTPSFTSDSAAFTPPANSLIVVCVCLNTNDDGGEAVHDVSDVGAALTWTKRVERGDRETTFGALSSIWTAPQVASASRTVRVTWTSGADTEAPRRASTKVYVVTGADLAGTPVDAVTGANEGGSIVVNILDTTTVTPGATGLLVAVDADWFALGAFEASSNLTEDTATYDAEFSVDSGYRTCTSGVGVSANFNAAGSANAQHKWCQIVVREAPAAGGATFGSARLLSGVGT